MWCVPGNYVRPGLARSSDTARWFSGRSAFRPASRRRRWGRLSCRRSGPGSLARRTHLRQLRLPDSARYRDHHERGCDDDRAYEDHGRLPPVTPGHLGRRRRLIPVSALSLHVQLETSNRFLEIATILQGDELECPDRPRSVAAVHRPRPGRAAPRLAAGPGSTERSACGIVTDLTTAGCAAKQKDGRRNRYQRPRPRTSRRSWRMTGTSSRMRPEAGKVIFEPGFVIRVRDHRPVTASPSGPAAACAVAGVSWRGGLFAWAGASCPGGGARRLGGQWL